MPAGVAVFARVFYRQTTTYYVKCILRFKWMYVTVYGDWPRRSTVIHFRRGSIEPLRHVSITARMENRVTLFVWRIEFTLFWWQ